MRAVFLIARRELAGYMRSMSGYLIIAMVLALNGLFFNVRALGLGGVTKQSAEVVAQFFYDTSGFTMIAAILISMRLLAEERQSGTLPLLYSSPVRDSEIILGKFMSGMGFLAIYLVCTLFMPVMILINGKVSVAHLMVGYSGLLLVGSATLAVGIFGSALAKNQLMAAIFSTVMVVTLIILWFVSQATERPLSDIFSAMALHQQHFPPFQSGIIHVRDVVYYLALTYVGLFASTRVIEARRWR